MLFRNQAMRYGFMNEAGEGEGGSAGGDAGEGAGAGDGEGEGVAGGGVDAAALQAQLAEAQRRIDAMDAKNRELLDEKRREKQAREQAERERAEKAGDYEQLFKSSEQQRAELSEQLESLRGSIANKERDTQAMRIASQLAEGYNAELLSEHIAKRLKYGDDGIKVLDENGNLTVSSLDDLKAEFEGSARFASLIKGRQASGGSASGGSGSGSAAKELTRSELERLDPAKKMEFFRSGGKLAD